MTGRRAFLKTGAAMTLTHMLGVPAVGAASIYPPVPPAYRNAARRHGVPAALLYAVALQESVLQLRGQRLPYPWTLNVEGRAERLPTYGAAVERLSALLDRGVRRVDCGALQVCWKYHAGKLGTPVLALNPWRNIDVGAALLRERYDETPDWFVAAGRYHAPSNPERAERYARRVFARLARIRHV